MIITRTPFRISLFGGGSDYPRWFEQHGGCVLGFAINKYCYISLRKLPPFFDHKHRIIYSRVENVRDVEAIEHPAVRHVFLDHGVTDGIELHHDGDLPARSGLGSSSSFTVGLLNGLYALEGRMASKEMLAKEAIRIEQDVIQENVGSQDQLWAAFGGFNRFDFHRDGSFSRKTMIVKAEQRKKLTDGLIMVFTGISRFATQVAEKKIANLLEKEKSILRMMAMVDECEKRLSEGGDIVRDLGEMLHESWMIKRSLSDAVTLPEIDQIYDEARAGGAYGGKLLGAGGGGFMVFLVDPARKPEVMRRLDKLVKVACEIDMDGSRVVVYEPDEAML
ncbi:MAG: kinase [Rhodospirillaceae bacterium]